MRVFVQGLAASCLTAGSAVGEELWERVEFDLSADAVLVASPGRDDAGALDARAVLFETDLSGGGDIVLDNGAEVGARLSFRAQRDHPARAGFTGGFGLAGPQPALRGAFSGLVGAGAIEDVGTRASLEAAYVYIDGGYGELLVGRDLGVAARFHEGTPYLFTHARAADAYLDPSGAGLARTINDVSGPSLKVSYATPRLLGFRVGASFSPDPNTRGLDRDPARGAAGVQALALDNAVEAAANVSRRIGAIGGARVRAGLGYSRAGVDTPAGAPPTSSAQTWSAGANVEWSAVTIGGGWLRSTNGGGRYQAWSAGAKLEAFGLDWGANYGEADDDLAGIAGRSWSFGVGWEATKALRLAAGVQEQVLDPDAAAPVASLGPVIEIALRL
ncbi:MAG: porin [Pseudomonadota bacterium]